MAAPRHPWLVTLIPKEENGSSGQVGKPETGRETEGAKEREKIWFHN